MASANINLPTSSKLASTPSHLPVGTICIIDGTPRSNDPFTVDQQAVLIDLADLVAREFQLGFETGRRERERKQALCVKELLNTSLVRPGTGSLTSSCIRNGSGAATHRATSHSHAIVEKNSSVKVLFGDVAAQLVELTGADNAAIIDVRNYRPSSRSTSNVPSRFPTTAQSSASPISLPTSTPLSPAPTVTSLASTLSGNTFREINILGSFGGSDFDDVFNLNGLGAQRIVDTLARFYPDVRYSRFWILVFESTISNADKWWTNMTIDKHGGSCRIQCRRG